MPGRNRRGRAVGAKGGRAVAHGCLGDEALRPGQAEAIRAIAGGRDTLAVLPTGAGKCAIYQVAGALRDGPTIVVSPIVALQTDQVDALEDRDGDEGGRRSPQFGPGAGPAGPRLG